MSGQIDPPPQNPDQIGPLLLGDMEGLQRIECPHFLGIRVEDLAISRNRRIAIRQQTLLNLADAEQQRLAIVTLRPLGLPTQHIDEIAPLLGLLIQPRQRHRRRSRRIERGRIEIEQPLPGIARPLGIAQLVVI